jgi:DNA replication protein DnaC
VTSPHTTGCRSHARRVRPLSFRRRSLPRRFSHVQAKRKPGGDTAAGDDDLVLERLRRHLQFLGLTRTLDELDERLAWAVRERPGPTALLEHVLGAEVAHKLEQRIGRRIDRSGLKERKTLEAFDFDFQPKLDKALLLELARLDFVRRHDDVVITGQPGTGKSHLLKAFGLRACEQGIRLRYARCVDLLDDLHAGLADGSYPRRFKAWAAAELLVIDDVGLGQVKKHGDEPTAAHTLYNLIDRRHGRTSTAVTSNIALSDWGKYLGDATLTAAILDRLAMHAIRIDIDGPSYRQHVAHERAAGRSAKERSPRHAAGGV